MSIEKRTNSSRLLTKVDTGTTLMGADAVTALTGPDPVTTKLKNMSNNIYKIFFSLKQF